MDEANPDFPSDVVVGITYDLRSDYLKMGFSEEETAEFDRESTIEAIEGTLQNIGFKTDRIGNIRSLVERLARGDRWNLVFNIAEGFYGLGREAQVPGLLDAYNIPYTFSDSLVLALTLHKGLTKRVIRDLGIPTPDFLVVERMKDLEQDLPPFPLFAKPVAEGTGKGITAASKVTNLSALTSVCRDLMEKYRQPVLVESFLPGREFTVGIIGTDNDAFAVGAMEVVLKESAESNAYSFTNKEKCEELVQYKLVTGKVADECKELALASWRGLGCRDGGRVDIRCDKQGKAQFLEVNPLPGIHPEHSDLPILCTMVGISYEELIRGIIQSAMKRYSS